MKRFTDAIFVDFVTILAPETPPQKASKNGPKIVRNALFGHLGRTPELGRPRGRNLDGFWELPGPILDDFRTILGRLWDVSGMPSEKPNFEELTLMIRATKSRSIDR